MPDKYNEEIRIRRNHMKRKAGGVGIWARRGFASSASKLHVSRADKELKEQYRYQNNGGCTE